MAKVEGLNLRGTRYCVRIIIPEELRAVYRKTRVNIALGTSDRREATLLATLKRAEWLADFDVKKRELKPKPLALITPELAQELALRIRARVLRMDDLLRDDPARIATLTDIAKAVEHNTRALRIGPLTPYLPPERDTSFGAGLSDDDAATLSGLNALLDARAGADLAKRRRAAVLPLVRFEALKLGVAFDPNVEGARLTNIKSLLKFAAETLQWIPVQPWRSLDIKTTTTNKRRPWTNDELVALFSSPLHTAYALPDARYGGREAAYWIPLLGLFTGTRLGELCQLRTVDVQKVEGVHVLVLTNEGEGQSIKSDAGHRSVPIHSELIRLGFLKYVETIKASRSDSLWPSLPLREGKPSDYFGRWFGAHCKAMGLTPTFHYLRHTVRPLMRRAGVSDGTMDKVTGHKTVGSVGTVVYDHHTLSEVQEAVEAIRYPALTLPAVGPYGAS
ncbi:site-specific integrase [Variovorax sp. PAMC26660]|uniref:site-specific integrase n=1 Tax=Variovorax sp. PAMC26660 TaxID=2762322 RepID=UPI00164E3458|nr:site-specific integrase [Variovorax sp. PAMC26660]QNK66866.1 site-specific integrase [Variovorax sp. PAMC26660]